MWPIISETIDICIGAQKWLPAVTAAVQLATAIVGLRNKRRASREGTPPAGTDAGRAADQVNGRLT